MVFEAADLVGGAAAYSGGQVWIGANHVAARDGIDDDLERTETYVRDIADDDPSLMDEAAMKRWLVSAPAAARYWEEIGAIGWQVIPGLTDYHSEARGALGVGRYLTNAYRSTAANWASGRIGCAGAALSGRRLLRPHRRGGSARGAARTWPPA